MAGGIQFYNIFGRQVGSHYLAAAWIGTVAGGVILASRSSGSAKQAATPPIQASSKEEEDFVQKFLAEGNAEQKH